MRQIAMITPLAIVDAVRDVAGLSAAIKWPNDVVLDGKKLAGMLVETGATDEERAFALVGAGINVNFDPRSIDEIRDIATSIAVALGRDGDREALLASYVLHFERLYDDARNGRSPRERWRSLLVTLGQRVTATEPQRVTEGIAEDVDDDGSLLVRADDGSLVAIEAGDVTLRA
jgi:BirA family biotin operon repressor/biotin-[acetyl-CoA-carboxylase] ligase